MALSVFDPRGHWVAAAFGPPEDGNWIAVSIDGRPVTANAYSVFIGRRAGVGPRRLQYLVLRR
jgi:hypothetical protein